jgi:sulfate adenylyltransferase subunit 1
MQSIDRTEVHDGELLRFLTAGSVDDGKSTLIGRLLHDSKAIFEDQLAAVERSTRRRGADGVDLSLFTDGLQAEREQGITTMWLTDTLPRRDASSSSPTPPVMSSTLATW